MDDLRSRSGRGRAAAVRAVRLMANPPIEISRVYVSREWREVVKPAALVRDGSCVDCGATDGLTGHHVNSLEDGGAPFDLENVLILCRPCHGSHDGRRSRGRPLRLHPDVIELSRLIDTRFDRAAKLAAERAARRKADRAARQKERRRVSEERALFAAKLRMQGLKWEIVAARAGYASTGAAYNAVNGQAHQGFSGLELLASSAAPIQSAPIQSASKEPTRRHQLPRCN